MTEKAKNITHSLRIGDVISFNRPDPRLLPRFVAWVLRRPAPMVRRYFKITSEVK